MNLFLLCDCVSGYMFNGIPYIGRQGQQQNVGLAADIVKTLCEPLYFSGVNVTTDNWFTSTNLTTGLLRKQITMLSTMRRNKPDIPKEFVTGKNRKVGSSLFGFCDRETLVFYVPKKKQICNSTFYNTRWQQSGRSNRKTLNDTRIQCNKSSCTPHGSTLS